MHPPKRDRGMGSTSRTQLPEDGEPYLPLASSENTTHGPDDLRLNQLGYKQELSRNLSEYLLLRDNKGMCSDDTVERERALVQDPKTYNRRITTRVIKRQQGRKKSSNRGE
ncbi:hypothetical protein SESBI_51018 [Sesbania bispinosa]|nr:hypothetical protein SESBI_51018 [Sesbania bispinosa]